MIWNKAYEIIENESRSKHFMRTNNKNYGIKEIVTKTFSYTIMKEVATDETGGSVGEFALLHK